LNLSFKRLYAGAAPLQSTLMMSSTYQTRMFGKQAKMPSKMIVDQNANKYQESQMLFFTDKKIPMQKSLGTRPKTISEIKKIQSFVKTQKETPGKSLNASIKSMAKRDQSFNEFLKNFKAKNEQNWASIIDMTQAEQEELLLAKSPEYRRNEMVMLEEFRRRKNMKDYFELMGNKKKDDNKMQGKEDLNMSTESLNRENMYSGSGPERYFERQKDEVFNPEEFTLIFIDSDSVTNVTSLNRVNHRRVLIFIGNGNGLVSFGKGKSEDYETAFDQAFKKMRQNLVCLSHDFTMSVPRKLEGSHNDFHLKILPQTT